MSSPPTKLVASPVDPTVPNNAGALPFPTMAFWCRLSFVWSPCSMPLTGHHGPAAALVSHVFASIWRIKPWCPLYALLLASNVSAKLKHSPMPTKTQQAMFVSLLASTGPCCEPHCIAWLPCHKCPHHPRDVFLCLLPLGSSSRHWLGPETIVR